MSQHGNDAMDHGMADQQQAAARYLLDELSAQERTDFEEHVFDCPICAEEVRQNFTVVENVKEVLREHKFETQISPIGPTAWLRPATLIPSFVALVLAAIVLIQNFGPDPVKKAQVLPEASLVSAASRDGSDSTVIVDRTKSNFLLSFAVDGSEPGSFVCDFQTASGSPVVTINTALQDAASFTLNVLLATKVFPPARYRLILHHSTDPSISTQYPFIVQDSK